MKIRGGLVTARAHHVAERYCAVLPYTEDDRPTWRLRVEWDPEDYRTRIAVAGHGARLTVDANQARWLIAALQAALARMESDGPI